MGNRKTTSLSIIHAVTKVYRAGKYVTCVRARQMREGKARRKRGGKIH